jgi:hypothetical protein
VLRRINQWKKKYTKKIDQAVINFSIFLLDSYVINVRTFICKWFSPFRCAMSYYHLIIICMLYIINVWKIYKTITNLIHLFSLMRRGFSLQDIHINFQTVRMCHMVETPLKPIEIGVWFVLSREG